jgi:hypothetical protein
MKTNKDLPNGFSSWQETHYEVVSYLTASLVSNDEREPECQNMATKMQERQGTGGLYELAEQLTDEFERLNIDRIWDGDFYDEIETFLNNKEKSFV